MGHFNISLYLEMLKFPPKKFLKLFLKENKKSDGIFGSISFAQMKSSK
jgi:hypothetical protein